MSCDPGRIASPHHFFAQIVVLASRQFSPQVEQIPLDLGPRHFDLDLSALSADASALTPETLPLTTAKSRAAEEKSDAAGAVRDLRPGDRVRCTLPQGPLGAPAGELPPALRSLLRERGALCTPFTAPHSCLFQSLISPSPGPDLHVTCLSVQASLMCVRL